MSVKPTATAAAAAPATPAGWASAADRTGRPCECGMLGTGCTARTARTFAPGHDAKAKSRLIAAHRAGTDVTVTTPEGATFTAPAREVARRWGFAHLITDAKAPASAE